MSLCACAQVDRGGVERVRGDAVRAIGPDQSYEDLDDEATLHAIRADRRLTEAQRRALLAVYRSYVGDTGTEG
jgi:hypothetical protein